VVRLEQVPDSVHSIEGDVDHNSFMLSSQSKTVGGGDRLTSASPIPGREQ
jgi:hypothetical protein